MRTDKELLQIWESSRTSEGWYIVFETLLFDERQRIFDLINNMESSNK